MKYLQEGGFTVGGNTHEDGERYRRNWEEIFGKKDAEGLSGSEVEHKGGVKDGQGNVVREES